jgi:hypothetical protein
MVRDVEKRSNRLMLCSRMRLKSRSLRLDDWSERMAFFRLGRSWLVFHQPSQPRPKVSNQNADLNSLRRTTVLAMTWLYDAALRSNESLGHSISKSNLTLFLSTWLMGFYGTMHEYSSKGITYWGCHHACQERTSGFECATQAK